MKRSATRSSVIAGQGEGGGGGGVQGVKMGLLLACAGQAPHGPVRNATLSVIAATAARLPKQALDDLLKVPSLLICRDDVLPIRVLVVLYHLV